MTIALVAGLVGVAGTVIGALIAMWADARRQNRAEKRARETTMREELKGAIADDCAAIVKFLAAGLDRWTLAPDEVDTAEVRERAYRYYLARTEASAARYRLELATADEEVITKLSDAFDLVRTMHDVPRGEALTERIRDVHAAVKVAVDKGRDLLGVEGNQ
jgi:hypothetical protein